MKFCQHCGNQLSDQAKFCGRCGTATTAAAPTARYDLVETLCSRLKINGIIWIVIAVLQILIGIAGAWGTLIIGVLNIISAIHDLQNSQRFSSAPYGIVSLHEPLIGPIITLAYNLIIGGFIGILGSIYYLVFVRGFVMENKTQFLAIENTNTAPNHQAPPQNATWQNVDVVYETMYLSPQEAYNGIQKELYISQLQKCVRVNVPRNTQAGQVLVLHQVIGTNQFGQITADVHIRIVIHN